MHFAFTATSRKFVRMRQVSTNHRLVKTILGPEDSNINWALLRWYLRRFTQEQNIRFLIDIYR